MDGNGPRYCKCGQTFQNSALLALHLQCSSTCRDFWVEDRSTTKIGGLTLLTIYRDKKDLKLRGVQPDGELVLL